MSTRVNNQVSRARLGSRARVAGAVAFGHALAGWALYSSTTFLRQLPSLQNLPVVLILTNNPGRASPEQGVELTDVVVRQDPEDPRMGLPTPPLFRYAESNEGAVSVAPQLLDADRPDVVPFARKAGLLPGESAVVVLNVEVLADGRVGQVQVDTSSGSDQIDQVAMEYARLLAWIPGRLHGMEERTWVRQGVRLAA